MALTHDQKRLLVGGSIGAVVLFFGYKLFGHKRAFLPPGEAHETHEKHEHRKKRRHDDDDREENDRGEYGRKKKHRHKEHTRD